MTAADASCVPRFGTGMKFRFDATRQAWVVLGPERLFLPDEHAVAVLKLVDGVRTAGAIAAYLAHAYAAPEATILADILPMLEDLAARGALRLTACGA